MVAGPQEAASEGTQPRREAPPALGSRLAAERRGRCDAALSGAERQRGRRPRPDAVRGLPREAACDALPGMRPPLCMRGVRSIDDGFVPPVSRGGSHAARVQLMLDFFKVKKHQLGGIRVSCTLKVCTRCIRGLLEAWRGACTGPVRSAGGAAVRERRRPRASAVPCPGAAQTAAEVGARQLASHLYTSCKGGIYGVLWAHARGPVRSWGVRRCGASLACLCARLSASRGSETPACEASPAALGATHGVVRMPAAARGRAAARGLTDESRLARRGASGAARASITPSTSHVK